MTCCVVPSLTASVASATKAVRSLAWIAPSSLSKIFCTAGGASAAHTVELAAKTNATTSGTWPTRLFIVALLSGIPLLHGLHQLRFKQRLYVHLNEDLVANHYTTVCHLPIP